MIMFLLIERMKKLFMRM